MKGVVLSIAPRTSLVDLSHEVDPQDVQGAAYLIASAYSWFPKKTVHVLVVDPGVGSGRPILAAEADGHFFLAPDNGLLTRVLEIVPPQALVRVENPDYFLHPVSNTFHGRDIFAPAAAYIAAGEPLANLGSPVSGADVVKLCLAAPYTTESGDLGGTLVAVDRFGNLISNIDEKSLRRASLTGDMTDLCINVGESVIKGLAFSYQDVAPGRLLAIIGSRGFLEISLNRGNAASWLGIGKGDPLTVSCCGRPRNS
ncbi:MAG: SAM-dependent chlorinase/fluorinase [Desulfosalsimonadaceae bacterium]